MHILNDNVPRETFSEIIGSIGIQAMEFIKSKLPADGINFFPDEEHHGMEESPLFQHANGMANICDITPIEGSPGAFKCMGEDIEWGTEIYIALEDLQPSEAADLADYLTEFMDTKNKIDEEEE